MLWAAIAATTRSTVDAKRAVTQAIEALRRGPLRPSAALYAPAVERALSWAEGDSLARRQFSLGKHAFDRGDYLRCTVLLTEALITARMPYGRDPMDYQNREESRQSLRDGAVPEFTTLNELRNALAHGSRSNRRGCRQLMSDEPQLRQALAALIEWVDTQIEQGRTRA